MATYKIKEKTDLVDMGNSVYVLTVEFTDKNGEDHEYDQQVMLKKGSIKADAQSYADEYEELFNKTLKDNNG